MNSSRKKEVDLYLQPLGYPWQSLEAEGVTWVILRKKLKLEQALKKVSAVSLEELRSWSVQQGARSLNRGTLSLSIYYELEHLNENSEEDGWEIDEPSWQLLGSNNNITQEVMLNQNDVSTSFQGVLLDRVEKEDGAFEKSSSWQLENVKMSWQSWFNGVENDPSLHIVKAHVTPIGLYSILIEIALKLEAHQKDMTIDQLKEGRLTGQEELLYHVKEERVQEALDIVFQRSFYQYYGDQYSGAFFADYLRQESLIFVGAQGGGERILIASRISEERNTRRDFPKDGIQPAYHEFKPYRQHIVVLGGDKVLCKVDFFWTVNSGEQIFENLKLGNGGAKDNQPSEHQKADQVEVQRDDERAEALGVAITIKRVKPCERWQNPQKKSKGAVFTTKIALRP